MLNKNLFLDLKIKMSFIDDEIENYQAKYGSIESNDLHFDDHPEFGFDYLSYKISKIKFWKKKKGNNDVLTGMQTTYKNIFNDEEITTEEHRGINKENNKEEKEINLAHNEYIINCSLWNNESLLYGLTFKTNLKNEFSVGDKVGKEMEVNELKGKKKYILSFFGTFGKDYLTSIGLFINNNEEFFAHFIKGYFQLKLFLNNKNNLLKIEKRIENNEFNNDDIILIKASLLPKILFHQIIKYISPI